MRKATLGIPSILLLMVLANSGCGAIFDKGVTAVKQYAYQKLDDKLRVKYNILPEDDIKTISKKMFEVENQKNPALATKLLAIGPEAWDEIKESFDKESSFLEKIAAGKKVVEKITGALEESKDANGTIKWVSGGSGGALLLFILAALRAYSNEKKQKELEIKDKEEVLSIIEEGDDNKTKTIMSLRNSVSINAAVTKLFPKKDKEKEAA